MVNHSSAIESRAFSFLTTSPVSPSKIRVSFLSVVAFESEALVALSFATGADDT
jgi:hypothetical protein